MLRLIFILCFEIFYEVLYWSKLAAAVCKTNVLLDRPRVVMRSEPGRSNRLVEEAAASLGSFTGALKTRGSDALG